VETTPLGFAVLSISDIRSSRSHCTFWYVTSLYRYASSNMHMKIFIHHKYDIRRPIRCRPCRYVRFNIFCNIMYVFITTNLVAQETQSSGVSASVCLGDSFWTKSAFFWDILGEIVVLWRTVLNDALIETILKSKINLYKTTSVSDWYWCRRCCCGK